MSCPVMVGCCTGSAVAGAVVRLVTPTLPGALVLVLLGLVLLGLVRCGWCC
jgi:hypothetical protein